jgi:hypothetical protein
MGGAAMCRLFLSSLFPVLKKMKSKLGVQNAFLKELMKIDVDFAKSTVAIDISIIIV